MEELIAARETLIKRVGNFKKSPNHQFTKRFLETVQLQTSAILERVRANQSESDLVQLCAISETVRECEWFWEISFLFPTMEYSIYYQSKR